MNLLGVTDPGSREIRRPASTPQDVRQGASKRGSFGPRIEKMTKSTPASTPSHLACPIG